MLFGRFEDVPTVRVVHRDDEAPELDFRPTIAVFGVSSLELAYAFRDVLAFGPLDLHSDALTGTVQVHAVVESPFGPEFAGRVAAPLVVVLELVVVELSPDALVERYLFAFAGVEDGVVDTLDSVGQRPQFPGGKRIVLLVPERTQSGSLLDDDHTDVYRSEHSVLSNRHDRAMPHTYVDGC